MVERRTDRTASESIQHARLGSFPGDQALTIIAQKGVCWNAVNRKRGRKRLSHFSVPKLCEHRAIPGVVGRKCDHAAAVLVEFHVADARYADGSDARIGGRVKNIDVVAPNHTKPLAVPAGEERSFRNA